VARGVPAAAEEVALFERFTEPARQVVVLSQDEARALGHDYIGTEHELLGLLRLGDSLATRVLESLGISFEDVRTKVIERVGRGEQRPTGQIAFTPAAKEALERSAEEATSLGHPMVGSEHVLLGLLAVDDTAAAILRDCGSTPDQVREALLNAFGNEPPASAWEQVLDVLDADRSVDAHLDLLRREGWEIVRVSVERRRRR
jgi:ATP-dependent Clp protease ATP-binding subunit ClpC